MNIQFRHLVLLPLLALPLACTESTQPAAGTGAGTGAESAVGSTPDAAAGSVGGVQAAGKSLADKAAGALDSATSAGASTVATGISELQPRIDAAIAKLKATGSGLGAALEGQMGSLAKYKDQIPALLEQLKSATGPELAAAVEQGKALLAEIPKLLASLGV